MYILLSSGLAQFPWKDSTTEITGQSQERPRKSPKSREHPAPVPSSPGHSFVDLACRTADFGDVTCEPFAAFSADRCETHKHFKATGPALKVARVCADVGN